jgi:hypothetical protein
MGLSLGPIRKNILSDSVTADNFCSRSLNTRRIGSGHWSLKRKTNICKTANFVSVPVKHQE